MSSLISPELLIVAKVNEDKGLDGINPDGFSGSWCAEDLGQGVVNEAG